MEPVRALRFVALQLALITASFSLALTATGYELRLVTTSPTTVGVGDFVTFDAYLDTEGESDIWGFQIGLTYDDAHFEYRPELSDATDYTLYTPSTAKADPPRWLAPIGEWADPPQIWGGLGPKKVVFEILSGTAANQNPAKRGTIATATNAFIGNLTFEAKALGSGDFDWGFGEYGDSFRLSDTVDIQSEISTPGGGIINVVPEPATALLVCMGLAGLGLARRGRN